MNKMYIITLVCLVQTAQLSAADAGHTKVAQPAGVMRIKVPMATGLLYHAHHEHRIARVNIERRNGAQGQRALAQKLQGKS